MSTKLILIGVSSIVGAGAISAVGYGIYQATHSSTKVDDSFNNTNETNNQDKNPSATPTNNGIMSDESADYVSLDELVKQVKESEIIVYSLKENEVDKSNTLERKDLYAFNIKDKQLGLDTKKTSLSENTKVEIKLSNKNTVQTLNKGSLVIEITLRNGDKTAKNDLTLTSFKPGDSDLNKIVTEENNNNFVLTLTPKTDANNKFISIEDLNEDKQIQQKQKSGLTSWLIDSTVGDKNMNLNIVGKVKLTKLEYDESDKKTYFHLVSKTNNSYLKLQDISEPSNIKELLISEIRITNLLATSINIVPTNNDELKANVFKEELKKLGSVQEEKYITKNDNDDLFVKVPKTESSGSMSIELQINPYYIEGNSVEENKDKLPVNIQVSFGKGSNQKTYSTNNASELAVLNKAGFGFYVYTKLIDENNTQMVKAKDLTKDVNKLETYFKASNFNMPIEKPVMLDQKLNDNGMYYVNDLTSQTKLKEPLNITVQAINGMQQKENKNAIVFASYTYKTADENNQLMNKVLYTPNLSLIHINKPAMPSLLA